VKTRVLPVSLIAALTVLTTASVSYGDNQQYELSFPPNRISTVVSDAVVRSDRAEYYFTAQRGQAISLAITALENNAVFSLFYRQNGSWQQQVVSQKGWSGFLPASENNRYLIAVTGTRGNATYDLFVGIAALGF